AAAARAGRLAPRCGTACGCGILKAGGQHPGEHRLLACPFRQLAEKPFELSVPSVPVTMLGMSLASCRRQQAGSLRSPEQQMPDLTMNERSFIFLTLCHNPRWN